MRVFSLPLTFDCLAKCLWCNVQLDDSGTISTDDFRKNLKIVLGKDVSIRTAASIVSKIELDFSGEVDEYEFVSWLVRGN